MCRVTFFDRKYFYLIKNNINSCLVSNTAKISSTYCSHNLEIRFFKVLNNSIFQCFKKVAVNIELLTSNYL